MANFADLVFNPLGAAGEAYINTQLAKKNAKTSSSDMDIYQEEYKNLGKGIDYLRARAAAGDSWAMDKYWSYVLSENSANTARAWEEKMNSSAYQRMVQDLQKAGINPYFALSGGSPISSSTQGVNYQGSQATSASNNYYNNKTKVEVANIQGLYKLIGNLLSSAGSVMAAMV